MSNRKKQILSMLKDAPSDSFLHFAMAKEHEKEENFEKAIEEYEWIRAHDKDYVGIYYHLAAAAIEIEREEEYIEAVFKEGEACAQRLGDQHALAELKNAHMNWDIER